MLGFVASGRPSMRICIFKSDDLQNKRSTLTVEVPNLAFSALKTLKNTTTSMWADNVPCRLKHDGIAALTMMASIVFSSFVQQVWPPLLYTIRAYLCRRDTYHTPSIC